MAETAAASGNVIGRAKFCGSAWARANKEAARFSTAPRTSRSWPFRLASPIPTWPASVCTCTNIQCVLAFTRATWPDTRAMGSVTLLAPWLLAEDLGEHSRHVNYY